MFTRRCGTRFSTSFWIFGEFDEKSELGLSQGVKKFIVANVIFVGLSFRPVGVFD